jgi:hypothetical protein
MISKEEARLGTLMANLFVVLLLVNFGIQIFVLGPEQVGYNQTWGPLLSATGFAVGFAFLFGGEDNPYVNITGSIAFVAQAVNTIPAFAGVAQENDSDAFLTTNQVLDATSGVNSGWGVIIGIFGLVVIRSSLSKQLIPNYGIIAGYGGATLILVSTLGFAYGVLPEALGIVVSVLGGLLLYPLFIFSLGKAFTNSQS